MALTQATITVPEQMAIYLQAQTKAEELQRNAMIMYPYVKNGVISHGRAAQILGMNKWELIELYNDLGFPYLSSISDYEDDLETVAELKDII